MIKPQVYHQSSLHPLKVGIWCALSWDKITEPIFFNKTVCSAKYQHIITNFLTNLPLEERHCYLQQDGAEARMSVEMISFLREFFDDKHQGTKGQMKSYVKQGRHFPNIFNENSY